MLKRFRIEKQGTNSNVRIPVNTLRKATEGLFEAVGMNREDAKVSANVLIFNDLRGNDTHGVSYMLRRYIQWFREGKQNPKPKYKILKELPGMALMDADGALGVTAGPRAMKLAVKKAKKNGIGCVSLINAGHLGGAGYHAMVAASENNYCIGQCFGAPGGSLVCPTFGAEPRFGTHPMAWAAPGGKETKNAPFLFDCATSQVAGNKIRLAARLGVKLAANWITDKNGGVITHEADPPQGGSSFYMTPLGGTRENGSHKGYGLACMIDILCNTMTGIGPGFITGGGGLLFTAYSIDAFCEGGRAEYEKWMDAFLKGLQETKPASDSLEESGGRVLYPGLYAYECQTDRIANGIPLHKEVLFWFQNICNDLERDLQMNTQKSNQSTVNETGLRLLREGVNEFPDFKLTNEEVNTFTKGMTGLLGTSGLMCHGKKRVSSLVADMSVGRWHKDSKKQKCRNSKTSEQDFTSKGVMKQNIIVMDGSMGRQLCEAHNLPDDELFHNIWSAAALVDDDDHIHFRDAVITIHKKYIDVGAKYITTNSYGVQPTYYKRAFGDLWEKKMYEHAQLAATLAYRARDMSGSTSEEVKILGCLPPLVETHRPDLFRTFYQKEGKFFVIQTYQKLANRLCAGGADYLLLETINCWEEAECALRGIAMAQLQNHPTKKYPIIVSMEGALRGNDLKPRPKEASNIARHILEIKENGITIHNNDSKENIIVKLNIVSLSFNCAPPEEILECLINIKNDPSGLASDLKKAAIKLGAYANLNDRKHVHDNGFDVTKDASKNIVKRSDLVSIKRDSEKKTFVEDGLCYAGYVDFVCKFVDAGAEIVGGCCGCGPGGIDAIVKKLT